MTKPQRKMDHGSVDSSNVDSIGLPTRTCLQIYFSPFHGESRALRAGRTVLKSGSAEQVIFVGYREGAALEKECLDDHMQLWRAPFLGRTQGRRWLRPLMALRWNAQVLGRYFGEKGALIQAHSLAALPAGVLLKWMTQGSLIYDAHELESERIGWPKSLRRVARVAEQILLPAVDHTLVVSDSIRQWYIETYSLDSITTIRNMPVRPSWPELLPDSKSNLRTEFGIDEEAIVFIYVGLVGKGRGTGALLEAFCKADETRHLVFLGSGHGTDEVVRAAKEHANIHFKPPVPAEELTQWIAGADVSVVMIENLCRSYEFSLPNKFFESILAGVPVLISPSKEMSPLLEKYELGWEVLLRATEILSFVNGIERSSIAERRKSIRSIWKQLPDWDQEQEKLAEVYRQVR